MTSRLDSTAAAEGVGQRLDGQVEAGRMPGYVAAVRVRGQEHLRAGGRTGIESGSPPIRDDTQFRIASITKPIGGALTLTLVRDGVLALDDPVARWLSEAAEPGVLQQFSTRYRGLRIEVTAEGTDEVLKIQGGKYVK